MALHRLPLLLTCASLLGARPVLAQPTESSPTVEGYTGILSVPTGEVGADGTFGFLYGHHRAGPSLPAVIDSFVLTLTALPYLELSARATGDLEPGHRDLSAGFKVSLPMRQLRWWLPAIGAGVMDIGGHSPASFFEARYVVATEQLGPVRLTFGRGFGPDRLKGWLGGIELAAAPWFHLLADHDAHEVHVGARALVPMRLGALPMVVGVSVGVAPEREGASLDFSIHARGALGTADGAGRRWASEHGMVPELIPSGRTVDAAPVRVDQAVHQILARLAAIGFENLRVGQLHAGRTLVVEYENSRFTHSELDGLGVVLGVVAAESPVDVVQVAVYPHRFGLALVEVRAPVAALRDLFSADAGLAARGRVKVAESLELSPCLSDLSDVDWARDRPTRPGFLRPRIILQPGISTGLATDYNMFDYALTLQPELQLPLWTGATVSVLGELPIAWTDEYERGGFRPDRPRVRLLHALVYQAVRLPLPATALLGAGVVPPDPRLPVQDAEARPGALGELIFAPHDVIRFRIQGALSRSEGRLVDSEIGSLRVRLPLDAFVEGAAGKFFEGSRGFRVDVGRHFGDTLVSGFYAHTSYRFGGISVSLPLTFRRDMRVEGVQVRGSSRWQYSQGSVVGEFNVLTRRNGLRPETGHNLDRVFYDNDRLRGDYVRSRLDRLREAFLLFGSGG